MRSSTRWFALMAAGAATVTTFAAGPVARADGAQPARPAASRLAPAQSEGAAARCTGENRPGRIVTVRGMPASTQRTARTLLGAAVRCDAAALIKRAESDKTRLSFGNVTPKEFFKLPEKETKYRYLVDALVKAKPGYEKVSRTYVWPRVATSTGYQDKSAWDEAVRAGLLTKAQAEQMQREGTGYLGWRIGVSDRGAWQFFVAGD